MPDHMVAIRVDGVTKSYGSFRAVNDVSFCVRQGAVTALLGPNGSGKSTTLRIMIDLCRADQGSVYFGSSRYSEVSRPGSLVGVLLDASGQHPGRTVRETARLAGLLAGVSTRRVEECLATVGLGAVGRRIVAALSLGMRQRLGLAIALLGSPRILLLDEPGNGLDPEGSAWLNGFLVDFARAGGAVLVSSHRLAEVEEIADDIVILDRGRVRYAGAVQSPSGRSTQARSTDDSSLLLAARAAGISAELVAGGGISAEAPPDRIGRLSVESGIPLIALGPGNLSLQRYFLENTNGEYRGKQGNLMHLSEPVAIS